MQDIGVLQKFLPPFSLYVERKLNEAFLVLHSRHLPGASYFFPQLHYFFSSSKRFYFVKSALIYIRNVVCSDYCMRRYSFFKHGIGLYRLTRSDEHGL